MSAVKYELVDPESSLFGSMFVQMNIWKIFVVTDGSTKYVR